MPQANRSRSPSRARPVPAAVSKREAPRASFDRNRPLVLDLDGALLQRGLLVEGMMSLLRRNILMLFPMIKWSLHGKAALRKQVVERAVLDVARLPVNDALVAYAREERSRGREIVLATAADELLARRIAQRFDFIDRVIASSGNPGNLKGVARAERLREAFPLGFHYAGHAHEDLPVWQSADHVIVVKAARSVMRQVFFLGRPIKQLAIAR